MVAVAAQTMSLAECEAADAADPLAEFRQEFLLPEGVIYLDGNSLGAQPRRAAERALDVVQREWGQDLIGSWNKNHWFDLPKRVGAKIAELVAGGEGGCVATDTTSVNVFKALSAAIHLQLEASPQRRLIISERGNFPTDLYMAEGLIELIGEREGSRYQLRLVEDEHELQQVVADHGAEIAVVLLTHVNYRSGKMWHMNRITGLVQRAGALMVWDLCHSAGAVPVDLAAAGVDFAVGCTYKYLNGGPGSPAFIWAATQHLGRLSQPLTGWWGHAKPFDMEQSYQPAQSVDHFLVGTQPILSLATMEVGLDIALRVDQQQLRLKSLALTSLFISLVESQLADESFELITPRAEAERGSHVSLRHHDGYAIMKALIARGVIGDYREPEVLRFGFAPLYNSYVDVWNAVRVLREIMTEHIWQSPACQQREAVT